jgi:hypothetical protein
VVLTVIVQAGGPRLDVLLFCQQCHFASLNNPRFTDPFAVMCTQVAAPTF